MKDYSEEKHVHKCSKEYGKRTQFNENYNVHNGANRFATVRGCKRNRESRGKDGMNLSDTVKGMRMTMQYKEVMDAGKGVLLQEKALSLVPT